MEAEIVAAAPETRQAVCCAMMIEELRFGDAIKCFSLPTDNASALHVRGNYTLRLSDKLLVLRLSTFPKSCREGDKVCVTCQTCVRNSSVNIAAGASLGWSKI